MGGQGILGSGKKVKIASEDDIHQCFRILFEREIGPHEMEGHMQFVGSPLRSVLAMYLNSPEFRQRGLLVTPESERPLITELDKFKIATDPRDDLIGKHIIAGDYEPEVAALVTKHLRPGMTFLDVGANVGFFSLLAASIVKKQGKVIAIEPSPKNVKLLEISRVLNSFGNLRIHAMAADDQARLLCYNPAYSNGATNTTTPDIEQLMNSIMVPSMPIDTIVGDEKVDFLKIDVEGFEAIALRGARSVLKDHRPMIVSEFAPDNIKGGPLPYLKMFNELGYKVGIITPSGEVDAVGGSPAAILQKSLERQTDHVDLWITPK